MNLLKTNREMLLKPLQAVSGIIEKRHTLPILSNVLIERDAARLTFISTDVEIEIAASVPIETDGETKAITVGARKLLDILRALPEGNDVALSLADARLQVKSGKSRFNLQTLPAEDFPRLAAPEETSVRFELPQQLLKSLCSQVQYAMAQQDIRYYLNGLLVVVDAGELRVIATDGHRLALASKAVAQEDIGKQEVILPRKTVLELTRLLGDTDEPVAIELSATQARFRFGDVLLASKLIDGKFPDYQRVIPVQQPKQLQLDRVQLQQALQRAAILASDKFRGVRWMLTENSLKISCSNTEHEEAQEEIDLAYAGEALDIGFNVGYLLDVLNNMDAENVDIALGDSNSSALITIPGRSDFKYVVMPMRI